MHLVHLLRVESRVEVSPASSPTFWLGFEVYPGKDVGRTDNRFSFSKEKPGEETMGYGLK